MNERRTLAALVLVAFAARAAVVVAVDGVLYPDEVYQSLEQAHRFAFGTGLVPWEWQQGARHPLFAWLLTFVLKLLPGPADLVGRLACAAVGALIVWPVFALARQLGATARTASVGAALWALASWPVLLGARALSESVCALPLVAGVLLLEKRRPLAAAACLSLAVMLRLQCALVPLVGVVWALLSWPRRDSLRLLLGLVAGAAVFGVLDALMWGSPFHSAIAYVRFNFLEDGAASFGIEPASYYREGLQRALGGVLAVLAFALFARRAWLAWAVAVVFVAAHASQPHKELRFLLPVLPIALAVAGAGLSRFARVERFAVVALVVGLVTQPLPWAMSFRMLGIPLEPQSGPAWDHGGSCNRLLRAAGRRDDACGVMLEACELGYSGGYTWFGRAAPLFDARQPAARADAWNLLISRSDANAEGREVLAVDGELMLSKVRTTCVPVAPELRLR